MSGHTPPPDFGIGGILNMFITDMIAYVQKKKAKAAEKRLKALGARQAIVAARESRAKQQQWLDQVKQQMARGKAGDASQAAALEALRGKGGRSSKFDNRRI